MGWSADQGGRPMAHGHQPPPASAGGLSWASSCLKVEAWPVLSGLSVVLGLHLVRLSLNLRFDFICDFMPGQSVLATCILAQKHILHILEAKV